MGRSTDWRLLLRFQPFPCNQSGRLVSRVRLAGCFSFATWLMMIIGRLFLVVFVLNSADQETQPWSIYSLGPEPKEFLHGSFDQGVSFTAHQSWLECEQRRYYFSISSWIHVQIAPHFSYFSFLLPLREQYETHPVFSLCLTFYFLCTTLGSCACLFQNVRIPLVISKLFV